MLNEVMKDYVGLGQVRTCYFWLELVRPA